MDFDFTFSLLLSCFILLFFSNLLLIFCLNISDDDITIIIIRLGGDYYEKTSFLTRFRVSCAKP